MLHDTFDAGVQPGGLHSLHEIKILICYLLMSAEEPLSREAISNILCEYGMANFFDISAAIDELLSLHHLTEETDGRFSVSDTGKHIAATLSDMIPYTLRERSVRAALQLSARRRNERENRVDIETTDSGCTVTCTIGSVGTPLLTFTLLVADELQAHLIRDRFLDNPLRLYQSVIAQLTGQATVDKSGNHLTIPLN